MFWLLTVEKTKRMNAFRSIKRRNQRRKPLRRNSRRFRHVFQHVIQCMANCQFGISLQATSLLNPKTTARYTEPLLSFLHPQITSFFPINTRAKVETVRVEIQSIGLTRATMATLFVTYFIHEKHSETFGGTH
jgi:hypothetical protein